MPRRLWAHHEGRRSVNAVRVYERRGQQSLYVEWYEDGPEGESVRRQRVLKTVTGAQVPNTPKGRALARRICRAMSTAQLRKREELAQRVVDGLEGLVAAGTLPVRATSQRRDLGSLLGVMHADRGAQWRKNTTDIYDRWRNFWIDNLGARTPLTEITPPVVRSVLREAAGHWSPGGRNGAIRYIKTALNYALHELEWTNRNRLAKLKLEPVQKRRTTFSVDEVRRLLPALEAVSPLAGWLGYVCVETGRRGHAVNQITRHDVTDHGDHLEVIFRARWDKAKREGRAFVFGPAVGLYRRVMLPVDAPESTRKDWMVRAHAMAGVEWVPRRSWHALKSFWSTQTDGMPGRSKQAGTTEKTLQREYTKEDMDQMKAVALRMTEVVG